MKPLLIFVASMLFFSCRNCGNLVCVDDAPKVKFSGKPGEVGTIWVIYHDKPTDTLSTYAEMITRSADLQLVEPIDMKRDVTIILTGVGEQYVLTDFTYEERQCEKGCGKGANLYTAFVGCKVNGQIKGGYEVYL